MGIRLIVEVMDYAPSTLTHREAWVLAVLAEDANEDSRITWNSVESPEILRRARVSRPQMYEVIKNLVTKGTLKKVTAGQRNVRAAEYMVLPMAAQCPVTPDTEAKVQGPQIPDTDGSQCPQNPDTDTPGQCPQIPDTEPAQRPESPDTDGSQCPQIPDTYPSLQERDISPTPPASRAPAVGLEEFETFWREYPRKVGKKDATKAYAAAIKDGADPDRLAAAAARHGAHWAALGRQPEYIPYPATWLRKGSYDDELHTPQQPAPQQPQQQTYADRGIF